MVVREVWRVFTIWATGSRAVDIVAEARALRMEMSAFAMTRLGVAGPESLGLAMGVGLLMEE
jgi:hypothetical protein